MIVASLLVSLVGVLAAGFGTFMAFCGNPRSYTTLRKFKNGLVDPPEEEEVGLRDLILDQRTAAAWVLAGTSLQLVSVMLALAALL